MHTYSVRPNHKFWAQIHKFQSLRVTVVLCAITSLGTLYGYKQSISSRTAQCVYYQQKQLLRKNKRFLSFRNFFLSLSFVNFSVLGDIIRNSSICYLNFYGHRTTSISLYFLPCPHTQANALLSLQLNIEGICWEHV